MPGSLCFLSVRANQKNAIQKHRLSAIIRKAASRRAPSRTQILIHYSNWGRTFSQLNRLLGRFWKNLIPKERKILIFVCFLTLIINKTWTFFALVSFAKFGNLQLGNSSFSLNKVRFVRPNSKDEWTEGEGLCKSHESPALWLFCLHNVKIFYLNILLLLSTALSSNVYCAIIVLVSFG